MAPRLPRGFGLPYQVAEVAVQHLLLIFVASLELRRLYRVQMAPPGIAIAAPLRVQGGHPGKGAPQWYSRCDKTLTQTVEQCRSLGSAKPFAHCPDVQFDDFSPERGIEAKRQQGAPQEGAANPS